MLLPIIIGCIMFVYATILLRYCWGWVKLPEFKNTSSQFITQVSIIVPVRNEELTIGNCLSSIAHQDYPKELFEIIVVDDASTDLTVEKVNAFKVANTPLSIQLITLREDAAIIAHKKRAIEEAIQVAKGKLIITTDADCSIGKQWLTTIVAYYETYHPKMIVSPVLLHPNKNLLGQMQAIEMYALAGVTAASISLENPMMCSGANLAYEKEVFLEMNGFEGNKHYATGDDMFLMDKIKQHHSSSIHYLKSREAVVHSPAAKTISDVIQQRKRWASKTFGYKDKRVVLLASFIYLFNFTLLLLLLLSFLNQSFFLYFLILLLGKSIIDILFLYLPTSFFKQKISLGNFLLAQLVYFIYVVWVGAVGLSGKYKWKQRVVRT